MWLPAMSFWQLLHETANIDRFMMRMWTRHSSQVCICDFVIHENWLHAFLYSFVQWIVHAVL